MRHGEFEPVAPRDVRERLGAVLGVLHLLFNEGYWSADDAAPIRAELCRLAIGLARSLHSVFPDDPEVCGLLSLLVLHEARRPARLDHAGEPVPLPEQDRARWDHASITWASKLLGSALQLGRPGPFQIEASISAVHSRAASAEETDWSEISELYALLERFRATPAVRVNRAFAVSQAEGPAVALALLERDDSIEVDRSSYSHLVRGTCLEDLGRLREARSAFQRACTHARNRHEKSQVEKRIARLDRKLEEQPA